MDNTVVLPIEDVWDVVNFYDRIVKDDRISSAVLEAFAQLFIDTSIGNEIGAVWEKKKGAGNE